MRKLILIFLVAIIFGSSSCVIHFKFPFICFRKECLLSVFDFSSRKDAGGKRGLKQKISIFIAKSRAKKIKRQGKRQRARNKNNPNIIETDSIPEKEPVTYNMGKSKGICRDVKLFISKKAGNGDTLLIYFPDHTRGLTDDEKMELKIYFEKLSIDSVTEVTIQNCHKKDILTEHEIICTEERERRIARYLKKLHVPKAKIKTKD